MQHVLPLGSFVAKYPSSETRFIPLEMSLKIVYKSISLRFGKCLKWEVAKLRSLKVQGVKERGCNWFKVKRKCWGRSSRMINASERG